MYVKTPSTVPGMWLSSSKRQLLKLLKAVVVAQGLDQYQEWRAGQERSWFRLAKRKVNLGLNGGPGQGSGSDGLGALLVAIRTQVSTSSSNRYNSQHLWSTYKPQSNCFSSINSFSLHNTPQHYCYFCFILREIEAQRDVSTLARVTQLTVVSQDARQVCLTHSSKHPASSIHSGKNQGGSRCQAREAQKFLDRQGQCKQALTASKEQVNSCWRMGRELS